MTEFELSPQEEAEKEFNGLMASPEIPDSVKATLAGKETSPSGEVSEQIEMAKKIMGNDFLGPDAVTEAFGSAVELGSIPSIPFSREELEKAKKLGQMLVLRVGTLSDGSQLNMKKIGEILDDKVNDDGKVFYDTGWYKEEKFFIDDTLETGWALVSKGLVPNSTSKNYLEQTGLLIEELNKSFGGAKNLPEEYLGAVQEFALAEKEIEELLKSDSEKEKAAEKLEGLQINQLLRQSPTEALYDLILYFQNTGERLLEDEYTWTKRRYSDGRFVFVGNFDSDGAIVRRHSPDDPIDNLGVSFSRSL